MIAELLLPEFDQEMAVTRRVLERFPEDKADYRPHEKSMTLGRLAGHVAEMPGWGVATLAADSFDFNPKDGKPYEAFEAKTKAELLEVFDKGVAEMRAALVACPDEAYGDNWKLLSGGETIMEMPRMAVLRGFVLSHTIHHRAQLGVYFRLNDIPLPQVYGPTADEPGM